MKPPKPRLASDCPDVAAAPDAVGSRRTPWSAAEKARFAEALAKFGPKNVKSIAAFVGTRTPMQVGGNPRVLL